MFCFWKDFFVTTSRDSQFGSFSSPVKVRCLLEQLRSLRHSTHAVLERMPCLSLGWNIFRHCPWAVFLPDVGTAAAKSTNGRRCNGTGGRVDCDDEGREVKFNEAQIKSKKNWLPFLLATGWTSLPSAGNKECHWWRSCCSSHGGDLQQMEGFRRVRRIVMANPLMFLGFTIFVVKCRTQPSLLAFALLSLQSHSNA